MIDINFLKDNLDKIKSALIKRGVSSDKIDDLLSLEEQKRRLMTEVQEIREQKNKISSAGKPDDISKAKELKDRLKEKEEQLKIVEEKFSGLLYVIPNIPLDDVPEGKLENDNKVIEMHGNPKEFKFEIKDHIALAKDDIDLDRAAKISGSRFVILKNDLVLLEFAIINMVLDLLIKNGFEPIIPPTLIKSEIMRKTGHADTKEELEERYYLQKDELFLVGTSEQSIVPIHTDEILENVPKRYVGFSSCFREEAGSYGKDTKGMFRLHQFDKIEMISFTAKQDSQKELGILIDLEKKILEMLEIPYRVVHLCAGDMSKPSASTFDLEAWFPSQEKYRELTSASNCTDYQARRLNIKYKTEEKAEFVHILNATAVAIQRTLIAILENHQQKEGKVLVPKALRKYLGKKYILGK